MKAWQLLKEKGWCRGTYARNGNGTPVHWTSEFAVSFCAIGAITKVSRSGTRASFKQNVVELLLPKGQRNLGAWNDDPKRTKAEVIALLKKANV